MIGFVFFIALGLWLHFPWWLWLLLVGAALEELVAG